MATLDSEGNPATAPKTIEAVNAARAEFHVSLADGQWKALSQALDDAPSPPTPTDPMHVRAEVKRFLKLHATAPGSAPFLLGFRALLEAQSGRTVAVVWRVNPAVLTQSGGVGWMKDAVRLLCTTCVRRGDLETQMSDEITQPGVNEMLHDEKETSLQSKWLAFQLPLDLGDVDLYKLLMKLPDRKDLSHAHPSGEIVANASLPEHETRVIESIGFGGNDCTPSLGKRRHVCCMIFVVAVACLLAIAAR